jgi:hypothetical protein
MATTELDPARVAAEIGNQSPAARKRRREYFERRREAERQEEARQKEEAQRSAARRRSAVTAVYRALGISGGVEGGRVGCPWADSEHPGVVEGRDGRWRTAEVLEGGALHCRVCTRGGGLYRVVRKVGIGGDHGHDRAVELLERHGFVVAGEREFDGLGRVVSDAGLHVVWP